MPKVFHIRGLWVFAELRVVIGRARRFHRTQRHTLHILLNSPAMAIGFVCCLFEHICLTNEPKRQT
jgi:hypothetical protein